MSNLILFSHLRLGFPSGLLPLHFITNLPHHSLRAKRHVRYCTFGDHYSRLSLQCHVLNSRCTFKSDDISKPHYRSKHCITIIRLQQSPEVLVLCFMFGGIHYGAVL